MREIFCPSTGLAASYPILLRHLYSINDLLKKDGILAPSDSSLTNTSRLYDLIGRPLDKIPTVHVGGTNGKVSSLIIHCLQQLLTCSSDTHYRAAHPSSCQRVWVLVDYAQDYSSVLILQAFERECKSTHSWFPKRHLCSIYQLCWSFVLITAFLLLCSNWRLFSHVCTTRVKNVK